MKTLFSLFTALFLLFSIQGQEICIVSADYIDGENYIVAWSKPVNPALYDSVYIYRKKGQESTFSKVGSQSMSALSVYKDLTSNTLEITKYRISFLDLLGNESVLSPWHQGVILDYIDGTLIWTDYIKENQVDESYITSYECVRDQTGLGAFTSMGIWSPTGPTSWFDQEAIGNNTSTYYVEVVLPSCYVSKANINTSRSNIKKQFPNSEAGINDLNSIINIQITPNPIESVLNIQFDAKLSGSTFMIFDSQGKEMLQGYLSGSNMTIDMNEFAKGTYYLKVETANTALSKMFVKN